MLARLRHIVIFLKYPTLVMPNLPKQLACVLLVLSLDGTYQVQEDVNSFWTGILKATNEQTQ